MAPGVGLLDYDNDGDLDVYLTQGAMLGAKKTLKDATFPPTGPLGDRFFRNDLVVGADGARTLRFTDVTGPSGINVTSYGMGVAAADYDNDGFVDIYRTGLSGSVLLHNNGNGTFTDVTARTGVGNPTGWGVPASFVDYDRDGWLDLYVGNYLLYSIAGDVDCLSVTGQHDYCPPNSYRAQADRLYHNRGNGTFEDVTSRALVGGADGPALGVSTADFDGDGWIDIYVGNDGQPNQLWINQKNGTFKDTAFISGAAVNGQGNSEASMGVDAGDYDNDGDEDIFITNWLAQMNILYVNMGGGVFEDQEGRVRPWSAKPREDRLRRRLVRLRQRLVARSAHRQWQRLDHRGAGARQRSVPAQDAQSALSQSGQRAVRGRVHKGGEGVHAERRQPRRGIR